MVTKLPPDKFNLLKPFFAGSEFDLLFSAVLEGNSVAQVWVNDGSEPESVFLWDKANNVFYLIGREGNAQFNREIQAIINGRVVPQLKLRQRPYFRIRAASELWEKMVPSIFASADLTSGGYLFYTYDKPVERDWRSKIPEGFKLERIDEKFLLETQLQNKEYILDEIRQMWPTVDRFVKFGFGFSLVTEEKAVCWCTAEYMSKGKCGIGIETVHEYQNRGLATSAASAFVEHCEAKGVKPHWECNAENLASRRVAEKVGFVKEREFRVFHGKFRWT